MFSPAGSTSFSTKLRESFTSFHELCCYMEFIINGGGKEENGEIFLFLFFLPRIF